VDLAWQSPVDVFDQRNASRLTSLIYDFKEQVRRWKISPTATPL
jgi:hypothetical protein